MSREELAAVAAAAGERRAARHEILLHQDDPATLLYLLAEGRVKLTQLTPEGEQVLLRFVEPGEMIGGIAVLTDARYPVTAEAAETSHLLTWDGAAVRELMLRFPKIALNVVEHLAALVLELQNRVRELATERVEKRLARALVRLAARAGERLDDGVRVALRLTRQDLGELTGTTLYTVSRTLSRWESEGIIESARGRVIVRNPGALAAIADDVSD